MTSLRDKKVLVLGLGETGLSLARYLSVQGARLRVADSRIEPPGMTALRSELPQAEVCCGAFSNELLQDIVLVAVSPGVPLADTLVQRAMAEGIPVTSDIELLAQKINSTDSQPRVIAITGANGKTTVTSMVGAMCSAAGLDTQVAGNISPAVLDALSQRDNKQPDVWVLELSSFQLEAEASLNADVAVVLNLTEDHLDRYDDMAAYAAAKARIFHGEGIQLINRDDVRSAAMAMVGRQQISFGLSSPSGEQDWGVVREDETLWLVQGKNKVLRADELQVAGLHNVANALAALALCTALDLPLAPLCAVLRAFAGLPHRMESVADIAGVTYYDDSKATNVGATEAALSGLGKLAVVILGGDGKGQDFFPLKKSIAQYARAVILIGRDALIIEQALQGCGKPLFRASDMDEAVCIASIQSKVGDVVLLSPACASFDMYRDYVHRAEAFVSAVHDLTKEKAWSL
jgi:UDP-N-acetylmuramoylalanine--D-glutamate ligase